MGAERGVRLTAEELAGLGGRLRAARRAAGKTLVQVADAVGVTQSALTRIETGDNEPRLGTLKAVCGELGVPLADVLGPLLGDRLKTATRKRRPPPTPPADP